MGAQGQHIGDVLVRANHDQRTLLAVDATQIEDVLSALEVRAEDFLMVDQAVTLLAGPQQRGQGLERQCAMPAAELPCLVICHCLGSPRQTGLQALPPPS